MTNKQIIDFINLKITKLEKEKDHMLDKMIESKKLEEDENLRLEYLKSLYAYEQILDIKAFIETGEIQDERFKERK